MDSSRKKALIESLHLLPHPEGGFYAETFRSTEIIPTSRGDRSASTAIYFLLGVGDRSHLHRITSDEIWHFYEGQSLVVVELCESEDVLTPSCVHLENGFMERVNSLLDSAAKVALLGLLGRNGYRATLLGGDVLSGLRPQYTVRSQRWFGSFPLSKAVAVAVDQASKSGKIEHLEVIFKLIAEQTAMRDDERLELYALVGCTVAPGFDFADFELATTSQLTDVYPVANAAIEFLTPNA